MLHASIYITQSVIYIINPEIYIGGDLSLAIWRSRMKRHINIRQYCVQ